MNLKVWDLMSYSAYQGHCTGRRRTYGLLSLFQRTFPVEDVKSWLRGACEWQAVRRRKIRAVRCRDKEVILDPIRALGALMEDKCRMELQMSEGRRMLGANRST